MSLVLFWLRFANPLLWDFKLSSSSENVGILKISWDFEDIYVFGNMSTEILIKGVYGGVHISVQRFMHADRYSKVGGQGDK